VFFALLRFYSWTDFVVLVCQDLGFFFILLSFGFFRLGTKDVQSIFPAVFICLCFCSIMFISGALHSVTVTIFFIFCRMLTATKQKMYFV